jgi:hypothetical protein
MRLQHVSTKRRLLRALGFVLGIVCGCYTSPAVAGPPFVTDDPEPTEYRHWEIYSGFQYENEGAGGAFASVPFAEFNYGAMPNVQVSTSFSLDDDDTDLGPRYRFGGTEIGVKLRFVQESRDRPQIAFYPSVAIPAVCCEHAVTFLPVWLQKSSGAWTAFGGGGLYINRGPGMRDYTFVGGALERAVSPATILGAELFQQGPDTVGGTYTTSARLGMTTQIGSYHALLFSLGRSFHGENSFSAYASYEFALGPRKP